MMAALYGTLIIMITDAATEHWNTQKAAFMRSAGICILFHKNQSPTVSASTIIRKDMMPCIERLVEKTFVSCARLFCPSSKVRYRCVAEVMDPLMNPNMATIPPTTL